MTSFLATTPEEYERPPVRVAAKKASTKKAEAQPRNQSPVARVGTVASDETAFAAGDKGAMAGEDAETAATTEVAAEPAPVKKKKRRSFSGF